MVTLTLAVFPQATVKEALSFTLILTMETPGLPNLIRSPNVLLVVEGKEHSRLDLRLCQQRRK